MGFSFCLLCVANSLSSGMSRSRIHLVKAEPWSLVGEQHLHLSDTFGVGQATDAGVLRAAGSRPLSAVASVAGHQAPPQSAHQPQGAVTECTYCLALM